MSHSELAKFTASIGAAWKDLHSVLAAVTPSQASKRDQAGWSVKDHVAHLAVWEDSVCVIRPMPTIESDGCRPPVLSHADQLFRQMVSTFSRTPESVVALVRMSWTACSGFRRSRADPIRSGAG
jgi:hypothetical protein